MRRLLQSMAQQALGVLRVAGAKRKRREAAERADVASIVVQDVAKDAFRRLPVARNERGRRLFDAVAVRIEAARLLECEPRVCIHLKIHQHVAVGKPGAIERGRLLHRALQFCSRLRQAPGFPVRTRKVRARTREVRRGGDGAFEGLDGGLELSLREQREPQQPKTVDLAGGGGLDRTQLPLGRFSTSGAQRRQRLSVRVAQPRL